MSTYKGYDLNNLPKCAMKEAGPLSRMAGAEGIVLLKNEDVLPFDAGKTFSVFGRTQIDYNGGGTGSGGNLHTEYKVNIIEGLKSRVKINEELLSVYTEWLVDHPFDKGSGWATEPPSQVEMPVSEELCAKAAKSSDCAVVVIGRLAGEAKDNYKEKGCYLLTDVEVEMIVNVCKYFEKVCVVVNSGNIIDMKWVEELGVPAVLYAWQAASEGGNALADVLVGDVCPSGRLTDTVAYDLEDYPSDKNHGGQEKNVYQEDIYVGYRYFETFAKDRVMYPFGFGLSYTSFECSYSAECDGDTVRVRATVKNVGKCAGKTVIQVYYGAPQGKLGNPAKQLIRYQKTKELAPNEAETLCMEFPMNAMASYDDVEHFAYMLLEGEYVIYVGENVRETEEVLRIVSNERIVEQLRQALAPVEEFERMIPKLTEDGAEIAYAPVTTRKYDIDERKKEHITEQSAPTGDRGFVLRDVADGKCTMEEFVGQLSVRELAYVAKGEGMNSPKGTAGNGGVIGAVTDELLGYGIPILCVADGPSGLRLTKNVKVNQIPIGTCLACTWNPELVRELYAYVGLEVRTNEVDILLAPGMNIHRHPLNGRNFEYYSEDPYLSGTMAGNSIDGLHDVGVMGTIKHFAANSQEVQRRVHNSVVSERALREIYLKGFEMCVKEHNATAIMTSYNKINGAHTATDYDLCTSILRDEWGFDGFVMSDWWTNLDERHDGTNLKIMVEAQNDVYMPTASAKQHPDNLVKSYNEGVLDIYFLRKCASNVFRFMLTSPALGREVKAVVNIDINEYTAITEKMRVTAEGEYDLGDATALKLTYKTEGSTLAQYTVNVFDGAKYLTCTIVKGTGNTGEAEAVMSLPAHNEKLKFQFAGAFEYLDVQGFKK